MRRLVEKGLSDQDNVLCNTKTDNGAEDVEMGRCMMNLKVANTDVLSRVGVCYGSQLIP